MGITDLDEQFTFYASYHHNGLNKLIHIICVWPILWTGMVFMEYAPFELSPTTVPPIISNFHPVNLPFAIAVFYASVYSLMDKKAGTLAGTLVFICLFTARKFYLESMEYCGYPAWQIALGIHVTAWILQFIGHGAFEGRSPALLDNIFQAFVMAPLFVFLEVLFMFGYRKDFQKKIWKNVEIEIAKFKKMKSNKKN